MSPCLYEVVYMLPQGKDSDLSSGDLPKTTDTVYVAAIYQAWVKPFEGK